jgi:hypothetical protein
MRRGISTKIDACKENVLVSIKMPCNLLVQTKISFLQKVYSSKQRYHFYKKSLCLTRYHFDSKSHSHPFNKI